MNNKKMEWVFGLLRLGMGWIFLWAFLDKVFGLGFATASNKSWLAGVSPTAGFLANAVHGPFVSFYHGLSGMPLADWMFMLGLLFIGLSLILGIFVRLGSLAAMLLLFLMYTAVGLPPVNNPLLDEHIIYILIMIGFLFTSPGKYFGFGNIWARTSLVQKFRIFE